MASRGSRGSIAKARIKLTRRQLDPDLMYGCAATAVSPAAIT